ncbi:hypothetical protein ANN_09625 [Periplaneta americana]|uniref:HAT C-terminal dimerisation domain-containing protein n=1 Tax=Periplaneta americana TaxID=6978 RepID=A0ABQ8TP31_PERAM|nr:hypothetical protein ANN_09625 [Periplaneta americana]
MTGKYQKYLIYLRRERNLFISIVLSSISMATLETRRTWSCECGFTHMSDIFISAKSVRVEKLFNDAVSTTRLFGVDGIGDSEMVSGEMRPRIRHCLTVGEPRKKSNQNPPRDLICFKYAPMTSIDVERSFSMFRNVLSENRRSFTPKNLEMTILMYGTAMPTESMLTTTVLKNDDTKDNEFLRL